MTTVYLDQATFGPFTTLASAATTDLGSVASNGVNVTGTTTVTSFGTGANLFRIVKFAAALTLTHNATSLILPKAGSNITTAAGDICTAMSDGSGNWTVTTYQLANGQALVGSAGASLSAANTWTAAQTFTPPNASTVPVTIKGYASQSANLLNVTDSSSNNKMSVTAGGNVGIGTTSPGATLDVQSGTITTSTPAINITQTWNASGTTFDAPLFMNVTDTASAAGSLLLDIQKGGSTYLKLDRLGSLYAPQSVSSGSNAARGVYVDSSGAYGVSYGGNSGFGQLILVGNSTYLGWSETGGLNVGQQKIAFSNNNANNAGGDTFLRRGGSAATLQFGDSDAASPVAQTLQVQSVSSGNSNTAGVNWTLSGSKGTGTGAGGAIVFQTAPAGSTGTAQNVEAEAMRITSAGNVGLGTASPTDLLDVNGSAIRLRSSLTPASSSAAGNAGEMCWDSSYFYVCVATNTWKRAALSTW